MWVLVLKTLLPFLQNPIMSLTFLLVSWLRFLKVTCFVSCFFNVLCLRCWHQNLFAASPRHLGLEGDPWDWWAAGATGPCRAELGTGGVVLGGETGTEALRHRLNPALQVASVFLELSATDYFVRAKWCLPEPWIAGCGVWVKSPLPKSK